MSALRSYLIDVRTEREFMEDGLAAAVNIPYQSGQIEGFEPYRQHPINLICESGRRAQLCYSELKAAGFEQVSIMALQMTNLRERSSADKQWSVDRQFRLALSVFLVIFLIGFPYLPQLLYLPLIISGGLLYSAISDNCYLKIMIAKMPWNKVKHKATGGEVLELG